MSIVATPHRAGSYRRAAFSAQLQTGTAENRGASNVDPSQTFFIVEIINMRTHKMLRLDVGYTYTLPVELSVAFDLHFEGAGQRPASTSTSNRRRRQTIATVPSSESSRDRSSTQGSSPMPSERHGGSREAEIESMSAAPPSPAGPYITDTSGRRNPLPPAPPAPVTLSLEPNTKYQVCVVTARKCTLNGHQMKWRNLYSKPAQVWALLTLNHQGICAGANAGCWQSQTACACVCMCIAVLQTWGSHSTFKHHCF